MKKERKGWEKEMRKTLTILLTLMMILSMAFALGSCKKEEPAAENKTKAADEKTEEPSADAGEVVKTFEPDSEEELGKDKPMQIASVTLYKDGSIKIVPTDDLKTNELGDSEADSLMPFAESGKVKDMYLLRIGNGGYRTIVALIDDGTVSVINTRALMEDHIIAVMDNLGGRDNFTEVVQEEGEDGFSIVGKTDVDEDVLLDPVILTEDEEPTPVEEQ